MESKRDKFKRIASKRVERILNDLQLLANCSNTYNYEYEEQEVKRIFKTLNASLRACKSSFESASRSKFNL